MDSCDKSLVTGRNSDLVSLTFHLWANIILKPDLDFRCNTFWEECPFNTKLICNTRLFNQQEDLDLG